MKSITRWLWNGVSGKLRIVLGMITHGLGTWKEYFSSRCCSEVQDELLADH